MNEIFKMYFSLLSKILSPEEQYNVYLDIKDTRSRRKVRKLREVLCNDKYDFTSHMIKHIQNIHSKESDLILKKYRNGRRRLLTSFLIEYQNFRIKNLSVNNSDFSPTNNSCCQV